MTHISEALLELLMRDGITREGSWTGHSLPLREIQTGKNPIHSEGRGVIGARGFNFGSEGANSFFTTTRGPRAPSGVEADPFEVGHEFALRLKPIGAIHPIRTLAEIADAVVRSDAVDVVDLIQRPHTVVDCPGHAMDEQPVVHVLETQMTKMIGANRLASQELEAGMIPLFPNHNPGFGIVLDNGAEIGNADGHSALPIARGMKERGAASDGARSQLRQREDAADMNSERDRGNVTPAKFTGLHIVVDNCRNGRTQPQRVAPLGVRPFLKLVSN